MNSYSSDKQQSSNTPKICYDVLFYKRGTVNKVHQDRNVSKIDGILIINPNTGQIQLKQQQQLDDNDEEEEEELDDDDDDEEEQTNYMKKLTWKEKCKQIQKKKKGSNKTKSFVNNNNKSNNIIYSGVQWEIAKKDNLEDEEFLILGNYHVQIINKLQQQQKSTLFDNKNLTSKSSSSSSNGGSFILKGTTTSAKIHNSNNKTIKQNAILVHRSRQVYPNNRQQPTAVLQKCTTSTITKKRPPPQPTINTNSKVVKSQPFNDNILNSTSISLALKNNTNNNKPATTTTTTLIKKRPLLVSSNNRNNQKKPNNTSIIQRSIITSSKPNNIKPKTNNNNNNTSTILPHIPLPSRICQVLRPHQIIGVDFLWNTLHTMNGAILGDEMGLGKTLMTIACIAGLHRESRKSQFVVVTPSSLVKNWANEFDKWLGKAGQPKRVVIHKGGEEGIQQFRSYTSSMKHQVMNHAGQVLIVSYDLFRRNSNIFDNCHTSARLLVVDEGHRLKNSNGSLTLTALQSLQADARLCITATPIQNNLCEFHSLANFCCPGILEPDLNVFRQNYEKPITIATQKNANKGEREYGLSKSKELESIIKTIMLRRLQKDVLKTMLPPRSETLLFCQFSNKQSQLYHELTSKNTTFTGSMSEALATLTKLRKVCSHPILLDGEEEQPSDIALSGKMIVLHGLLQAIRNNTPNDKVVIVSNFTSALSIIETMILKPNQLQYLRLDGTTKNRQELVDTFNRSSPERNFTLLLSSKAGGCGLNLIGANRLVMFDPSWNASDDIQAMARVYRQGQTKPCHIYRLFSAGTVEEVIYQRQSQKVALATHTVDGTKVKRNNVAFTREEIADCFTLKQVDCDTKVKLGQRWAAYDGHESLLSQGCVDSPLLVVAKSLSDTLRFVHIVQDSEVADRGEEGSSQSSGSSVCNDNCEGNFETDSDSENEFDM